MTNLFDLSGETAVVLGGAGALGGANAEALAKAGAKVAIVDLSAERGAVRVKAIEDAGGQAIFVTGNSLEAATLVAARETIEAKFGPATILLNAAGGNHPDAIISPGEDVCKLPIEAWQHVFNLNLVGGALLPCQIFGESMLKAAKGSIINIASMSGIIPLSRVVAYSAAKAAVINLTKFLAREWATTGVRVNSISPGFFPAKQNAGLLFNEDGSYTDRSKLIIGHTPMGRFGNPEELAGAIIWLASSKASSFVTGANIAIDGGFSSTTI
ncbi:MAG: SDR family oxidoreductase [Capsulimonadaceae bacterium]|nr:SDR family oxidoreductase [Capsulimonadaceae bacterium]